MINIFAKRAFLNTNPEQEFISKELSYKGNGHLQRVSSIIRADQIVEYLADEAKLSPTTTSPGDINIYVKPHVRGGNDFDFLPNSYLDIIDGWGLIPLLEKHPEVKVIACSKRDQRILQEKLPNEVVFIPQQSCNFERARRTRTGIKTIGIIGTEDAFEHIPPEIEEGLEYRGIKLLKYSKFFTREDIVNFYKQIDIQLVWRPYRMRFSNPLKIVNASSFGIPTIAYEEEVFEEMRGCYVPVVSPARFLSEFDVLANYDPFYDQMARDCLRKAEEYHISKVAELYKSL